jgi:hypothetical protein
MTAGNATSGSDFQGSTSGTITWVDGDADPKILEFTVIDEGVSESDEFFEISLSNSVGATLSPSATLTATIRNSGGVIPPPPPPPPATSSGGGGTGFGFLILLSGVLLKRRISRKGVA